MIAFAKRWQRTAGVLGAAAALALASFLAVVPVVSSESANFFRIGTASTAGTYFPIGGLLANAISHPHGSLDCERGGTCGVPGMIAVVQSTEGSVDNVDLISRGTVESGLIQADVAYWAYEGEALFEDSGRVDELRTISNLYPEAVHLVVNADLGVWQVSDLEGLRISLDREGSGTRVDAELILEAHGLSLDDIDVVSVPAGEAADLMREGELDGFFFVAGTPARAVTNLAREVPLDVVPLNGPEVEALIERYPFFATHSIPAGTYHNVPQVDTIAVGAQWIVSAGVSEETVYQITRALWHPSTRLLLDSGHPKGAHIQLETALDGLGVPLHPGAERFYREAGLIEPEQAIDHEIEDDVFDFEVDGVRPN